MKYNEFIKLAPLEKIQYFLTTEWDTNQSEYHGIVVEYWLALHDLIQDQQFALIRKYYDLAPADRKVEMVGILANLPDIDIRPEFIAYLDDMAQLLKNLQIELEELKKVK